MSIALEMSSDLIEGSGFMHHGLSIFESSSSMTAEKFPGDRRFPVSDGGEMVGDERDDEGLKWCSSSLSSSSSSSIGKNSDVSERSSSDGEDDSGETEVQSSYKGPFVSMEALEEVLPIRRGISSFYNGKSKSFASLADASSVSSMKHISKPENAYTRKRRNLLAFNHLWDKNQISPLRSNGGGISKRSNLSRSTLALAVAMSSSESITASDDSNSSSPPHRPPLHPQTTPSFRITSSMSPQIFTPWKSFSVADLQHCATAVTTTCSGIRNKDGPLNELDTKTSRN